MAAVSSLESNSYMLAYNKAREELLSRARPVKKPHALLVTAQQGSGKSTFLREPAISFPQLEAPLVINRDELKAAHPPATGEALVDSLQQWMKQLVGEAAHARVNILVEATLWNDASVETVLHTALGLRRAGYTTEIASVAVNWRKSMRGMFERCEAGLRDGEKRWPGIERHAMAYDGMKSHMQTLEAGGAFDIASVYDRNRTRLHSSEKGITPDTIEAIEQERGRPWTVAEKIEHLKSWRVLMCDIDPRSDLRPAGYMEAAKVLLHDAEWLACANETANRIDVVPSGHSFPANGSGTKPSARVSALA